MCIKYILFKKVRLIGLLHLLSMSFCKVIIGNITAASAQKLSNYGGNRNGNEIRNDLHMSGNRYIILGDRFANSALCLIKKTK